MVQSPRFLPLTPGVSSVKTVSPTVTTASPRPEAGIHSLPQSTEKPQLVTINHYHHPHSIPNQSNKGLLDEVLQAPEGSLIEQQAQQVLENGGTVTTNDVNLSLEGSVNITDETTQVGLTLNGSIESGAITHDPGESPDGSDDRLNISRTTFGATLGVNVEQTNPADAPVPPPGSAPVADPPVQRHPSPQPAPTDPDTAPETSGSAPVSPSQQPSPPPPANGGSKQ